MPDIQITDNLGNSVPSVKIDITQPSSLLKYAKTELLHLLVAPDYLQRAPQLLTAAAPNPISFQVTLKHQFQLGNTKPEIDLTPSLQATIRVNATPGANLFESDPFRIRAIVPAGTGYVSVALLGLLDLGVTGSAADLTFGFTNSNSVGFEFWKAFSLGAGEPTLGAATGAAISGFVIPADVDDLALLGLNDIATASGTGSLKISGGFKVTAAPNPLASVDLPLNAGTLAVKAGAVAGLSASFTISGSYQVRVRRSSADAIELSFCKQQGTTLKTDLSASAGVSVKVGDTDLLPALLGAISSDPDTDAIKKLFADGGLTANEISNLTGAIKDGLDHSLQASLDLALSQMADDQAAFQYEIRPAQLDSTASAAVHRALDGDLSGLTMLEESAKGADLAPGVRLISSVLTSVRRQNATLKLNLFGLVNVISISELIRKCVVVKDPLTGDLTIADSATGNRLNAVSEDMRRNEALRKALFDSLTLTAAYRVSNTVDMSGITSHNFHFAFNQSTKSALLADYLNWFKTMNLLTSVQVEQCVQQFHGGGPSTCLLRTEFDERASRNLFFEAAGQLWDEDHYLELGRQAMRALIDPNHNPVDKFRYELLDQHWPEAVQIGANDGLAQLVGLHLTDSTGRAFTQYLVGDVATITWWASAMVTAGKAIVEMQSFLNTAITTTLAESHEFAQRRDRLQKTMAGVIRNSRMRFDEPWGLLALFWAAGSTGGSGRLVAEGLLVQKP